MRAVAITKALTAASANNIAISQTLGGAGNLTLNGAAASGGVATLDSQRRVIVTSAGNDAGLTWTIIGTDDTGSQIKDQFPGANGVAQSNLNFKTVSQVSSSAAAAAAVTVGTNTVGSSPWVMFDSYISTPHLDIEVQLVSGSGNVSIETTQDPFLIPIPDPLAPTSAIQFRAANPNPFAVPFGPLEQLTASTEGQINNAIHAWRLTINSGTGTWKATGRQAGVASP